MEGAGFTAPPAASGAPPYPTTLSNPLTPMDIRFPIGYMFGLLGIILAGIGLSPLAGVEKAQGININLWWGLCMIAFAAFMLGLAFCAARKKAAGQGEKSCCCSCSK